MKPRHRYRARQSDEGKTVESFLVRDCGLGPRQALKRAFVEDRVRIGGKAASRTTRLAPGDTVEVASDDVFTPAEMIVQPNAKLPLRVALMTPDALVLDKPAGQSAHPLKPTEADTTLNAIAARYPESALAMAPDGAKPLEGGLVHRIDRGTSGLLTCARDPAAWQSFRAVWKSREIEKVYLAWVEGTLETSGRVDLFLSHDPKSRRRMAAHLVCPSQEQSWAAATSFQPLRSVALAGKPATLVLVRIHSGVTHQIRATLAALGSPVLGDAVYSRPSKPLAEVRPLPLDPMTRQVFQELRTRLAAMEAPSPELLPERGFFLHALWLRSDVLPALARGVFAPPPGYFG